MKLYTEMQDRMNGNGMHPVCNDPGIRPERGMAHDAAAANALVRAIAEFQEEWEGYGEPAPSSILDRAAELMREWGFTEQAGEG